MAKPNKKGPVRTVDVLCAKCRAHLFKYRKGGKGRLIKCFKERIVTNYTTTPCECPECAQTFARECLVRGTPAFKVIGGKVLVR